MGEGGQRNPPHVAGEDGQTHGGPAGPAAARGHPGPSLCSHPGAPHSPRRPGGCRPRADAGAGRARGSGGGSSNSSKSGSGGPIPAAGWRSVHGRAGARTDGELSQAAPAPPAALSALLRRRRPSFSTGQRRRPHPPPPAPPMATPSVSHARSDTPTSRGWAGGALPRSGS